MEGLLSAADRYYQIERLIMVGRARCTLSEAHEDELLEESDELWRLLTPAEREEVDERVSRYALAEAAPSLGLLDCALERGDWTPPRI
jgi:hypothetical protein